MDYELKYITVAFASGVIENFDLLTLQSKGARMRVVPKETPHVISGISIRPDMTVAVTLENGAIFLMKQALDSDSFMLLSQLKTIDPTEVSKKMDYSNELKY